MLLVHQHRTLGEQRDDPPLNEASLFCICSVRGITAEGLATAENTSAPCLGVILSSKITHKKHQDRKIVAPSKLPKGHWFAV